MGDKKKYQSVLEAAYGGRIDVEENSREQLEDAFPSSTNKENPQRGGPKLHRERNGRPARDPPNAEAAGPVRLAIRPPINRLGDSQRGRAVGRVIDYPRLSLCINTSSIYNSRA